jgi:hypothetical protein
MKELTWKMEGIVKKTENDLQYMDSKLSLIDDSAVMKKWVNGQIEKVKEEVERGISEAIKRQSKEVKERFERFSKVEIIGE